MAGTRPMLFGISVILVSGFLLVDGTLGSGGLLPLLGLFVGLGISLFGLLYGVPPANSQ